MSGTIANPPWLQAPIADVKTGRVTDAWARFLIDIWTRTGSGQGSILDANARVAILDDDVLIGTRRRVNLLEGTNVTLDIADNPSGEKVDVLISAAGVTELESLTDVDASGKTNGSLLEYVESTTKWTATIAPSNILLDGGNF